MPRLKTIARKFDDAQRQQLSWNLAQPQPCPEQNQILGEQNELAIGTDKAGFSPVKKKIRRSKKNYMDLLDPELQDLICRHDYYITIKQKKNIKINEIVCLLGHIEIILDQRKAPYNLPNYPEFWLYVNEDDVASSFLYFEEWNYTIDDTVTVKHFLVEKVPPPLLMSSLRVKQYFTMCLHAYDPIQRKLSLGVLLKKNAITHLDFPSEATRITPNAAIQNAMQYMYNIFPPDYSAVKRIRNHDINALYAAINEIHSRRRLHPIQVDHPALIPVLRPYQTDAVVWMLHQEQCSRLPNESEMHQLYQVVKTSDNKVLYYNKFGGCLVKEKPLKVATRPGGILADEMGLGKTVEVLACVLCNPRTDLPIQIMNFDVDFCDDDDGDDNGIELKQRRRHLSSNQDSENNYLASDDVSISDSAREADSEVARHLRNGAASTSSYMCFADHEIIHEPESIFSCVCGLFENETGLRDQIQCAECGLWQHTKCVRYDRCHGRYFCLHCWVAKEPIPSRATLIVCPASIHNQWLDEISRHVQKDSLKVFNYAGVFKFGFIQPPKLADYDIVITTYEILRRELHYVDLPHSNSETGRRFRKPKRFMPVSSPLTAVEWWRICLDEAQMVETVSTRTADMALRLHAVNRWCITGTPIQKSIEDLYGLLLFLGTDPFSVRVWWRQCLFEPYCYGETEQMHRVLSSILWRTSKADVLNQIQLPEQREEIHYMRFSPIEEYFYRQQHVDCSREAVNRFNKLSDLNMKLSSLDRNTLSHLLGPVLRLRQACCHPQAVKGQFISVHKSTLTMEELLVQMIKKTKMDAEEAHRQHIAALNGLAGLNIIQEEWVEASENYRDVLRLAAEDMQNVETDKMQRLHALHNLAELLDAGHTDIPPTLRDDQLKTEADEMRRAYLTKCAAKATQAQEALCEIQETCREVENQLNMRRHCWWMEALNILERRSLKDELLERIRTDLVETGHLKKHSIVNQFRSISGLKLVITSQMETLTVAHDALLKAMQRLELTPNQKEVNSAVDCHLRPVEKKPAKCIYCLIHELFNRFEGRLFSFATDDKLSVEPSNSEEALMGPLRRGTWADSEVEKIFKILYSFAKNHNAYTGKEIDEAAIDIKLFDLWKKEFKALRAVWMQVRDHVSAVDELNMATIRLRLRLPDEPKSDRPQANIIESDEINQHRLKLQSDKIVSTNEKKKKLGQLLYLKNLAKSDLGKGKGNNPEPCPICQKNLGAQWNVLQCGHSFCVECIQVLISQSATRSRSKSVKCAICRQTTAQAEVSYITTKPEDDEDTEIKVNGSYSTKIDGIIKTLLKIKQDEPQAKALVFSTWQDVLDVLAKGLLENKIRYCRLVSSNKFQENLAKFKRDASVSVLLLLVQSGANGLNLIEATHVLLVEPVLNPASELQAIGRVHRIGQNKHTYVHRFLVKNTIEERMHLMLKSHQLGANATSHETEENTLTISDLRNLFADETVNT
uniref:RING-type domain-containing protein n=1 Tax=Strigamia maritima TaxID=126957 RepID=T1JC89_STRMM